ncbi:MAG: GDP-mannose 4,6-dehydratase [Ktedonobacteraceae bacterium]|nr:GDP-mannose 4,6-dehydratase [Ktedonobacteraceae bacterium]
MYCLVTGVAGFIGSHLAERLLADGHEVCGIDNFIDYYPRQIKENNLRSIRANQRFSFVDGDLLTMDLSPYIDGVDWIFHQAAQPGVRGSWGNDFARYVECNVLVTHRLLELALRKDIKRFVYASSSSVYGDINVLPLTESTLPRPFSPYGVTKLAAEHLCKLYYENFKLATISLRYFTVYGPRQRPDMAFHRFCKAIIERQPLCMYGNGEQTRDFTYVSDVVEANLLAATSECAIGKVLNIAGGARASLHEVIHLLQEISGLPAIVTFNSKQFGDVQHTCASTACAEEVLGYHPVVALREGLYREFQNMLSLYGDKRAILA